ncbi:MAG: hypothetical protein RLZZ447_1238 [Verrucomicrobiota bacterium]
MPIPVGYRWLGLAVLVCGLAAGSASAELPERRAAEAAFLEELQIRAVRYFTDATEPGTGLVLDRVRADGRGGGPRAPSSVAATGFGLTAWCIAEHRGWLTPAEARRRVRTALQTLVREHEHERGWFYHFVDATTGRRVWDCEASTIDTALLLQGALLAREHLRDLEVDALVARIYERIDWRWAQAGERTLVHGWRPESGFLPYRWEAYAELLGLYLLGLGAPDAARALPTEAWGAWRREPWVEAGGRRFIQCGPLFTHQYAHGWFDFRGHRDNGVDYWENSVAATLAQRAWSLAQRGRYPHWSGRLWGLTASDSAGGYVAWGTPGPDPDLSDGTVVPCAPGGSLPFAPRECLDALLGMRDALGGRAWGPYGFADAFNPHTGWIAEDVVAINVGITLVMAENLRSGFVWRTFQGAPEVRRGFARAGFTRESPARGLALAR